MDAFGAGADDRGSATCIPPPPPPPPAPFFISYTRYSNRADVHQWRYLFLINTRQLETVGH